MDVLNIKSVAKAFLELVTVEFFEEDNKEPDVTEKEVARILLDSLFEIINTYVLVEENVNTEGKCLKFELLFHSYGFVQCNVDLCFYEFNL